MTKYLYLIKSQVLCCKDDKSENEKNQFLMSLKHQNKESKITNIIFIFDQFVCLNERVHIIFLNFNFFERGLASAICVLNEITHV